MYRFITIIYIYMYPDYSTYIVYIYIYMHVYSLLDHYVQTDRNVGDDPVKNAWINLGDQQAGIVLRENRLVNGRLLG